LDLPGFTPDIEINLGHTASGLNLASAIAVSPTDSHTVAVELSNNGCCATGPLEFFTDSTKLANSVASPAMTQLAFASGTMLFGYESGTLSQVSVSSTGGSLTQNWTDLVTGSTFNYSGGLIFGSNGQEFNPATGLVLGTFDVGSTCCNNGPQLLPNSAINRAFALGQTPFFNEFAITSYNLAQFTPLAVANLSELNPQYNSANTSKFIPWGTNGLAFILTSNCCGTTTSQVVLVQSPTLLLTATKHVSPVPVSKSSSPPTASHGTANFRMAIKGSGFVPGSVVTWNGKTHSASYVNETEMTVYVRAADVASPGTADVVVKNPTPGGGKSNTLTFPIK
jgi:trimeric autotransporter adhesin